MNSRPILLLSKPRVQQQPGRARLRVRLEERFDVGYLFGLKLACPASQQAPTFGILPVATAKRPCRLTHGQALYLRPSSDLELWSLIL